MGHAFRVPPINPTIPTAPAFVKIQMPIIQITQTNAFVITAEYRKMELVYNAHKIFQHTIMEHVFVMMPTQSILTHRTHVYVLENR